MHSMDSPPRLMPPLRLSALTDGLAVRSGPGDPEIFAATFDVAEVGPGVLFVARRDWYGDTHGQVPAALAAGASAVLVSRATAVPMDAPAALAEREDPTLGRLCARLYGHPTRRLRVYGVTGTKGKTTVTWMLEHMLRALGEVPALMGTLCYRLGDASVGAPNTTPDALVVQSFAADALARGATALVLEVSSHALAIGRVAGVSFDSVGFTNLGRDHLDFHATDAAYFGAKARLFGTYLEDARAVGKTPSAAVCLDTAAGHDLLAQIAAGVPVRTVSLDGASVDGPPEGRTRLLVSEVGTPSLLGMCAALSDGVDLHCVETPVFGEHHLLDAGLAVAMLEGTHPGRRAEAWASLADFPGVPGRLERVAPEVFVDYAHTADSVARLLSAVRARTERPVTVVLGCGGDRDRGKRPEMARAAADGADRLVLTSDNPRGENPERILDDMVAGLPPVADYARIVDRALAIAAAVAGDGVVVIAGKGHERTQTVGAQTWHFDDREEARRAWVARASGCPFEQAAFAWGAPDASPAPLLDLARRRAPGLWVVEAAPAGVEVTLAAVAKCVGAEHCLAGDLAEIAPRLSPVHRAVVLVTKARPLAADEAVVVVADARFDEVSPGEAVVVVADARPLAADEAVVVVADARPMDAREAVVVVADARFDEVAPDALDRAVSAAYAAFEPGRAAHRRPPHVPRLPCSRGSGPSVSGLCSAHDETERYPTP